MTVAVQGAVHPLSVPLPDGARLAATVEGHGPTLLLVSGLSGQAAFWASNAATLARSFRIIRFDQRGIGASTRGQAVITIGQLAQDCLSVLDAAGAERAVMLGHSTGGCIGQCLARLAPARLDGLILSGTWLKPNRYMAALFSARLAILAADPRAYAQSGVLMSYPPRWLEAHWEVYKSTCAAAPLDEPSQAIVAERIAALLTFDGSDAIAELAMPALVLGARDDMVVPPFLQEELAAALPGARKTMLDTGGHFFPISRPDAFTAAVAEWMGELG